MIDAQYPSVSQPEQTPARPKLRPFVRLGLLLRVGIMALLLAFVIGFALFTSKVTGMTQHLPVAKADAIIVLTGGTDRLKPAFELLENGFGKKLLISGVNPETTKKEIMRVHGINAELASCCVDLDQIAANTIGNATQSAKWLRANGFASVILVTSNYHMPRADKELKRLAGTVQIKQFPLVNSDLRNWKWLEQPDAFRLILTEYLKFTWVSLRHLITPSPGKSDLARISG